MKTLIIIVFFLVTPILIYGQEGLKFGYTIQRDSIDSSLIRIGAKIINKTNEKIYFLSESCNGLNYYLKMNNSKITPSVSIHCNVTYPRKIEIDANSEYVFNSVIKINRELKVASFTLIFVQLNSTTEVDGRHVNEIQEEYSSQTFILKGDNVEIK